MSDTRYWPCSAKGCEGGHREPPRYTKGIRHLPSYFSTAGYKRRESGSGLFHGGETRKEGMHG